MSVYEIVLGALFIVYLFALYKIVRTRMPLLTTKKMSYIMSDKFFVGFGNYLLEFLKTIIYIFIPYLVYTFLVAKVLTSPSSVRSWLIINTHFAMWLAIVSVWVFPWLGALFKLPRRHS